MDLKRELEISKLNLILSTLYPVQDKYRLQYDFFDVLVKGLMLEDKYQDEITAAGKDILKHLDLPTLNSIQPIMNLFTELYDVNSRVRFALETLDSIETIRILVKETPSLLYPLSTIN
jgi:hypothetical protein